MCQCMCVCACVQGEGDKTVSAYVHSYLGLGYDNRWLFVLGVYLIGTCVLCEAACEAVCVYVCAGGGCVFEARCECVCLCVLSQALATASSPCWP